MCKKILVVCDNNIVLSPMAEAIINGIIKNSRNERAYRVESAAIKKKYEGRIPDERSIFLMLKYGYDILEYKAKVFKTTDYLKFDYIITMTRKQANYLTERKPVNIKNVRIYPLVVFSNSEDAALEEPPKGVGQNCSLDEHFKVLINTCSILMEALGANKI